MSKWTISIPASTANLGPGFDSIGIALDRYLELEVAAATEWKIENLSNNLPDVSNPQEHLVVQAATKTAKSHGTSLPACHLKIRSEIPLARGMGSSASAVVAGIEFANQVLDLQLSAHDKLKIATSMEGHPDNAAASIFGGFTISSNGENGEIDLFHSIQVDASFVLFIPNFELKTEKARKILPESYSRKNAAQASAIANLFVAAFLSGSYEQAGKYMEQDLFHEPYRLDLIPESREIIATAKTAGAYGTCISGAGPTLLSVIPLGQEEGFIANLTGRFPNFELVPVAINRTGVVVSKSKVRENVL